MKNKALMLFLALCMILAMLPMTAHAAQNAPAPAANAVGTLEGAAVSPNAKSYSVTLTGSGHGEVELLVDSPVQAGSKVYFSANPDNGYLAEIYSDDLEEDALVYVGADVYGFIMPANKVRLEVKFVAAQGSSHSIEVYENGGVGQYELSRFQAKQYESVLLAVAPRDHEEFEPEGYVWVSGAPAFYLFENEGIYFYEIIMGQEQVNIFLCYNRSGPFRVSPWIAGDEEGVTVTVSPEKAYVNDLVTVTIKLEPGYDLIHARAVSYAGDLSYDLTPIGNDQYVFRMHPSSVELHILVEAQEQDVTVNAGSGGTARADVTRAKVGSTVTVTCEPQDNYRVDTITGVEGLTKVQENIYEFTMPDRDVTLNVTFKTIYNPVTVTVENGLGGTADADVTEARAGDTVTLTCTPAEGYRLARIAGVKDVTDHGDGTYTFTMPDEAVEIRVLFLRHENPFFDVNETQFFYEPVLWAVEEGITSGISETEFGPFAVCNRAQVVTFLWRYAGSPEPETADIPFEDVPVDAWYAKAVLWAMENDITKGVSDTRFDPDAPCNRAQVVTFLWRYQGQPEPGLTENPFIDVVPGWYEKPVLWALEKGITAGAAADLFNPDGQCQRAQVVTFLYRTAQLPAPEPVEPIEPSEPVETYKLELKTNGHGTFRYVDGKTSAAPGESIFFYAIPDDGYELTSVGVFNPDGEIDVSRIKIYEHADNLCELVMIDHDLIVTLYFEPIG